MGVEDEFVEEYTSCCSEDTYSENVPSIELGNQSLINRGKDRHRRSVPYHIFEFAIVRDIH